nr:hypothetical protein [Tanacetum cinerariifolium]
ALETTKANQALEFGSLKRRVKKLEKKASKKTHKLKRLYKIGSLTRMKSFEDASLGDQEDASKQERMIADLDADEGVASMLFNNTIKWIDSFVPMDTELVKGSEKAVEGSKKAVKDSEKAKEGSFKRAADKLEQEDVRGRG